MKPHAAAASIVLLALCTAGARAFDGHAVTVGVLRLSIGEVADVTACDAPRDVAVTVHNAGKTPLSVRLRLGGLVDEWRAVGETARLIDVAPGKSAGATFRIAAGKGTCSALYPVHVWAAFRRDGRPVTAHAVRVFRCRLAAPAGGKLLD